MLLFVDIALDSAKRKRLNRYVVFSSSMYQHYLRNRRLSTELREPIQHHSNLQLSSTISPLSVVKVGCDWGLMC